MSVFRNPERNNRWTFDFRLRKERFKGYCVDPETGREARNKSEAKDIEATIRRAARQTQGLIKSGIKPGAYSLGQAAALHMLRLRGTGVSHIDNNRIYVEEILGFFGGATAIADITAERLEEYRAFAAAQRLTIWIGGPARKRDEATARHWRTSDKIRSPRRTNYYLKCLRAIFAIAHRTRDPFSGQSVLPFPIDIKLYAESKRVPRPMPDAELDARMAIAPPWTQEAAELARLFGLRGSEALSVEIRHIDHSEGELFFPAGETKGNKDERASGGDEGYELLCKLERQAVDRNQVALITWPGPKHWRAFVAGKEIPTDAWRPLTTIRKSWRTSARKAGIEQPHRYHDVRARYITEIAKVAPAATQDAARHVDPSTTARYIKLADNEVRDAVRRAVARRRPKLTVVK